MLPSLHLVSISANKRKAGGDTGEQSAPTKRNAVVDEVPSIDELRRVSSQIEQYLYPYLNKHSDTNDLWASYWDFNPGDASTWTAFEHINYIRSNETMIVGAAEIVRTLGDKLKNKTSTPEEQQMALAWVIAAKMLDQLDELDKHTPGWREAYA